MTDDEYARLKPWQLEELARVERVLGRPLTLEDRRKLAWTYFGLGDEWRGIKLRPTLWVQDDLGKEFGLRHDEQREQRQVDAQRGRMRIAKLAGRTHHTMNIGRSRSKHANMPPAFGDRLWIVRKRVLAFCAVFLSAAALGALLVWYVSDAEADPGPVVYAFPVLFAILIGTFPVLAYYLTRWVNRFDVANCPTCDHFIWPTTIQAVQVALIPRCPHCLKRLGKVGNEE